MTATLDKMIKEVEEMFDRIENPKHFIQADTCYETRFTENNRKVTKVLPPSQWYTSYGIFNTADQSAVRIKTGRPTKENEAVIRGEAFNEWLHMLSQDWLQTLDKDSVSDAGFAGGFMTTFGDMLSSMGERMAPARSWFEGRETPATLENPIFGVNIKVEAVKLHATEIEALYRMKTGLETQVEAQLKRKVNTELEFDYGLISVTAELQDVVRKSRASDVGLCSRYNPAITNIEPSGDKLVDKLKRVLARKPNDQPDNLCMLFYGAPGTGKTELAKYIAQTLERDIMQISYGELQDKYAGEGEKNLIDAFDEAEMTGSILLLDEFDSLANNRSNADTHWQKTMTSQLLTCIDRFKGICIVTTNFIKDIDPAVSRRFPLKTEFKFLTPEQKQEALKIYFPKIKGKVCDIQFLTPADFSAARTALLLDEDKPKIADVRKYLEAEVERKKRATPEILELMGSSLSFT